MTLLWLRSLSWEVQQANWNKAPAWKDSLSPEMVVDTMSFVSPNENRSRF